MEKNHKHLILNAKVTNPINCDKECEGWLTNLVKLIDMEILVPPMVKYCDIEGNEGVTGVVVITTSHISIHIWPQQPQPYIRMDVYSCKDFDLFPNKLLILFKTSFSLRLRSSRTS